jgi:hypothetical protein
MKEIQLTQGQIALIDDEDFELVNKFKWCAEKRRNTFYASTCLVDGRVFHMHSLILLKTTGHEVDHDNRNGLDNRRLNLKLVTRSQNNLNSGLRRDNTTKIKGVYYNKSNKNWYARISVNKKWIYLGSFATKEEATNIRRSAELAEYKGILRY